MCDFLAIDLKAVVIENLNRLEKRSVAKGKKLTQKRGSQNICVIEAFGVHLDKEIALLLVDRLTFKKKHQKRLPRTLLDLIECCGGLSNAIEQLRLYQRSNLAFEDQNTVEYVDMLEHLLTLAKGKTAQYGSVRGEFKLPFCALCWRRTFASQHYCKEHHPSRNPLVYKASKHRLITAIEKHSTKNDFKQQVFVYRQKESRDNLLAKRLYAWTGSFSKPANMHGGRLQGVDGLALSLVCDIIIEIVTSSYPNAHNLISFPTHNVEQNLSEWVVKCIASVDKFDAMLWQHKDNQLWLEKASSLEIVITFLHAVSRMEAKVKIDSLPIEFGPQRGTGADQALRANILELLDNQRSTGKKLNKAEIARALDLSRQRVHKIIKEMEGA